jgi:hypothetical protein
MKGIRTSVILGCAAIAALLAPRESERGSDSCGRIEIVTTARALESLRAEPRKRVPARITISSGREISGRIRLKGHGSFRPVDDKPSLTIDFDSAPENWPKRVHLNNSIEDATYIQEKLGGEICALAGLEAPRVWHARVKLDGRDLGLYVLKEGFTPEFLARIGIQADGPVAEDDSGLRSIIRARHWPEFEAKIAMTEFISLMAAEILLCHWDGYSTSGHNVRVVLNAADGKYYFLPAGMDQLFGNPRYPSVPDMTGALARAVMETPEGRARYQARLMELSRRFEGREWAKRARSYGEEIRSALAVSERAGWAECLNEFCARLIERDEYLDRRAGVTTYAALR